MSRAFARAAGLFVLVFAAVGGLAAAERLRPGELMEAATDAGSSSIRIVVVSGDRATNVVSSGRAAEIAVEVVGRDGEPIRGAEVNFQLPEAGAGGVLADGLHSAQVVTDEAGRARLTRIKPTGVGEFTVNVSAAFRGSAATTSFSQTNYATVRAAANAGVPEYKDIRTAATGAHPTGLSTRAKVGIIAGVAAVALAGTLVAVNRGGSSAATTAAIPTASINLGGAATTGTPH